MDRGTISDNDDNFHVIVTVDIMYGIGFMFLAIVLVTASLGRSIRRSSTWYMFIASWLLDCAVELFLVGQQTASNAPSYGVCVLQAALLNATPIL